MLLSTEPNLQPQNPLLNGSSSVLPIANVCIRSGKLEWKSSQDVVQHRAGMAVEHTPSYQSVDSPCWWRTASRPEEISAHTESSSSALRWHPSLESSGFPYCLPSVSPSLETKKGSLGLSFIFMTSSCAHRSPCALTCFSFLALLYFTSNPAPDC